MIVADTSALAAIILGEEDADVLTDALANEDVIIVGAPTAFELKLVLHQKGRPELLVEADWLLNGPRVRVVPFGPEHLTLALDALVRFGGRPGRLNYGDCMAYAIAKALDLPLLFKGRDFTHTDLRAAPVDP